MPRWAPGVRYSHKQPKVSFRVCSWKCYVFGELQCLAGWLLSTTGFHGVLLGLISLASMALEPSLHISAEIKHHKPCGVDMLQWLKDPGSPETAAVPHHGQKQLGPPEQQWMHVHGVQTTTSNPKSKDNGTHPKYLGS